MKRPTFEMFTGPRFVPLEELARDQRVTVEQIRDFLRELETMTVQAVDENGNEVDVYVFEPGRNLLYWPEGSTAEPATAVRIVREWEAS